MVVGEGLGVHGGKWGSAPYWKNPKLPMAQARKSRGPGGGLGDDISVADVGFFSTWVSTNSVSGSKKRMPDHAGMRL